MTTREAFKKLLDHKERFLKFEKMTEANYRVIRHRFEKVSPLFRETQMEDFLLKDGWIKKPTTWKKVPTKQ